MDKFNAAKVLTYQARGPGTNDEDFGSRKRHEAIGCTRRVLLYVCFTNQRRKCHLSTFAIKAMDS